MLPDSGGRPYQFGREPLCLGAPARIYRSGRSKPNFIPSWDYLLTVNVFVLLSYEEFVNPLALNVVVNVLAGIDNTELTSVELA